MKIEYKAFDVQCGKVLFVNFSLLNASVNSDSCWLAARRINMKDIIWFRSRAAEVVQKKGLDINKFS